MSSFPGLRARSSAWKAVSLSIQNSSRTIPNPWLTYQNLLIKDRVLRFTERRSGESYHGVALARDDLMVGLFTRMISALLYQASVLLEPIGREQERVW